MKKSSIEAKKAVGKKKGRKGLLIAAAIVLVLAVGAAVAVNMLFVFPAGRPVLRSSTELDLRLETLTPEEYLALAEELPQCRILWSIDIGGTLYDSTAEKIAVADIDPDDISLFSLFENLQMIDATNASCYDEILQLQQALPDCEILWNVRLGNAVCTPKRTRLELQDAGVSAAELLEKLVYFPENAHVELGDTALTAEERAALTEAYPRMQFVWTAEVAGAVWKNTDSQLSYAGGSVDTAALAAGAEFFENVERIDLTGCGCTLEELIALQTAYPGALILSELTLYGKQFTTDAAEIDLSGIDMGDTADVEQALAVMPNLEKVVMSECGFSDEEMDALNRRYEDVMFVWTVHFSDYALRTDATYFCASDLPSNNYYSLPLTSEELQPLKYCTELIALDLGHMRYDDLSFLENLTKIRYLILVDAKYSDISPLANMKDLYYLELFRNDITDITPLLECKNLRHLNLGYVRGFDASVLEQMTWLERLWYPGHKQSDARITAIREALVNTYCYMPAGDPDGSTGGGWREHEAYYEMRDFFDMFYMEAGTGTDSFK